MFRLRGSQAGFPDGEGSCFVFRGLKEAKTTTEKQSKNKRTRPPKTEVQIKPPKIIQREQIKEDGVSELKQRLAKSKPQPATPSPKSAKLDHLLKLSAGVPPSRTSEEGPS